MFAQCWNRLAAMRVNPMSLIDQAALRASGGSGSQQHSHS